MAKITVYAHHPFLTIFRWLGNACMFGSVAALLSKSILSAYWMVVFGLAILCFCDNRAAGRKTRYKAGFVAILVLVYPVAQLVEYAIAGLLGMVSLRTFAFPILLAAALLAKPVKNKPLAAAIGCFILEAFLLIPGVYVILEAAKNPSGIALTLAVTMLAPALLGVILLLRGRKMQPYERQIFVF